MLLNCPESKQIWFIAGLLIFFTALEPTLSSNNSLSPDSVRLYHDIVSGQGLYNGFTKLTQLGGSNFQPIVFGNETKKMWLVEFYNSWCGHCHKFAPTWKALASDVYEWRDVIKIGVVQCNQKKNIQLCRDMETKNTFPLIRLFPPYSHKKSLGEEFKEENTTEELRVKLVKRMKNYHLSQNKVEGPVNLKPITNIHDIDKVFSTDYPSSVVFVILVSEGKDSIAGAELALDLSKIQEVRVFSVYARNTSQFDTFGIKEGLDGVVVVDKSRKVVNLEVNDLTRHTLNTAVMKFLLSKGIKVSSDLPDSLFNSSLVLFNSSRSTKYEHSVSSSITFINPYNFSDFFHKFQ